MSDDGLNLSRRKVLGGITTVGAASAAAGAGTFALFSDTSKTNTTTISTGTVSFKDGNPTELNITAENQGATGQIEGNTKFTYKGSKDAAFVIGMKIDDVDGDSKKLADQIVLDGADIKIREPDGSGGRTTTSNDTFSGSGDAGSKVTNELETSVSTPTLADLNSELSGNESITVENSDGSTETVSALKYCAPLKKDDAVKLHIDASWDLSNDFQGQEIGVTVYGKVVETSN